MLTPATARARMRTYDTGDSDRLFADATGEA